MSEARRRKKRDGLRALALVPDEDQEIVPDLGKEKPRIVPGPHNFPNPSIMDWKPDVTVEVSTNRVGCLALDSRGDQKLLLVLVGDIAIARSPNRLLKQLLDERHEHSSKVRIRVESDNEPRGSKVADILSDAGFSVTFFNPFRVTTPVTPDTELDLTWDNGDEEAVG